jgi:ribosomal protein S6
MKQSYEFSYWLKESANEENPALRKLFDDFKFEIIQEAPPKTKKLAYPINKESIGKFGTFYFYADPEKIDEFKNKVQKISDILRFIILKRKHLKLNNK